MCGIVGYIGKDQAVGILMEGLKRLEYRGYDSAGVAVLRGGEIDIESNTPQPIINNQMILNMIAPDYRIFKPTVHIRINPFVGQLIVFR